MSDSVQPSSIAHMLLEHEGPLVALHDVIVALDLIAGGAHGIELDDMVGLKLLTRLARDRVEVVRQSWRDALARAQQAS